MSVEVRHGDCIEVMASLEPDSFAACVTDPPAGISFMQKSWDSDKGGREQWVAWMTDVAREVYRVCKPGAHALVWSLPRTSHWTGWAWENAGWVPRDCVYHLFASGFPKSHDVSKAIDRAAGAEREVVGSKRGLPGYSSSKPNGKSTWSGGFGGDGDPEVECSITAPATEAARQWAGWGTALKPAAEQWWLFRKPLSESSVAANVIRWGTGALNIDASRVGTEEVIRTMQGGKNGGGFDIGSSDGTRHSAFESHPAGRWPANVAHSGDEEVMQAFARFGEKGGAAPPSQTGSRTTDSCYGEYSDRSAVFHADTGTAARFFKACQFEPDELRFHFCGKATKDDRAGSSHPTIKPISLMSWLCQLVCPPGGKILDPFAGTGSTLVACDRLGFDALGIEQDAQTVADAHEKIRRFRARRAIGDVPDRSPAPVGQSELAL